MKRLNGFMTMTEVSDGWLYPPLIDANKSQKEKGTKKFQVFADYHLVPCTHLITFSSYSEDKAKFLILGIGFFFGVYLSPIDYYKLGKVAYRIGKLTGVSPANNDIELAMGILSRYYDSNPHKRKGMFAIIHWFLVSQSYNYPWDRFEGQYKVLDGIYNLSDVPRCSHADRPNKLAEAYNVCPPDWIGLTLNNGKSSVLSQLRNDLAHEGIYANQAIGYAHPNENYDLEFSNFNTKLIAAALGVSSNFLEVSPHDRQYHLWNIV